MARYKHIDTNPRFLPVDLARQLLPGTFEHAVNHLLDHAIDLSPFDARFRNDETGAPAYPPAMLLKVVLVRLCSRASSAAAGSRQACREHVTFIALCGDTAPHFTTIAHFVSTLGRGHRPRVRRGRGDLRRAGPDRARDVRDRWREAPEQCGEAAQWDARGLRASRRRSSKRWRATMVERHRAADAAPVEPTLAVKDGETDRAA